VYADIGKKKHQRGGKIFPKGGKPLLSDSSDIHERKGEISRKKAKRGRGQGGGVRKGKFKEKKKKKSSFPDPKQTWTPSTIGGSGERGDFLDDQKFPEQEEKGRGEDEACQRGGWKKESVEERD